MESVRIAIPVSAAPDRVDIQQLLEFQGNLKDLSRENFEKLKSMILKLGFSFVIHVWEGPQGLMILDGHQRLRVLSNMRNEGYEVPPVPIIRVEAENFRQAKEKVLAGTSQFGNMTQDGLYEFIAESGLDWRDVVSETRFPEIDFNVFSGSYYADVMTDEERDERRESGGGGSEEAELETKEEPTKKLSESFLVPPFSVLDCRQGYWQERKRAWLALGIQSEVGRQANLLGMSATVLQPDPKKRAAAAKRKGAFDGIGTWSKENAGHESEAIDASENAMKMDVAGYDGGNAFQGSGTSIFDPVLCELAYRWFSPPNAKILDPFAGGSVRGIVASKTGREYFGGELRQEQVEANREQGRKLCDKPLPTWECADSRVIDETFKDVKADMVFSCPPYADLEVYSDDPQDLSTLDYDDFRDAYFEIIKKSCSLLKDDRFACFVVGEVRGKEKGKPYLNFVGDTIKAFEAAGLRYYNEIILVTSVGTLALRVRKMMNASRKVGKTHQNVLVFVKGDPAKATAACGEIEISDIAMQALAEAGEEAPAEVLAEAPASEYGEEL